MNESEPTPNSLFIDFNVTYEANDVYYDLNWFFKFFAIVPIYTFTFIVGLLGNILVIFSIFYLKKLQSVLNFFLVSLATTDLLLIIVCLPIRVFEFFSHYWYFGPVMCKVFNYVQNFTAICSVFNLTIMSLERYLAILHPLKAKYTCTKQRAKIIIFFIWTFSLVFALPVILGKQVNIVGLVHQVEVCERSWDIKYGRWAWILFEVYRSLILLVFPLAIIIVSYTYICIELCRLPNTRRRLAGTGWSNPNSSSGNTETLSRQKWREMEKESLAAHSNTTQESEDDAARNQIIKMLMFIILLFFFSWAPIIINHLLVSFDLLPNMNLGVLWYVRSILYLLSYTNSCINPIVYALMSKNFRKGFKYIFARFCCCFNKDAARLSLSYSSRREFLRTEKFNAQLQPHQIPIGHYGGSMSSSNNLNKIRNGNQFFESVDNSRSTRNVSSSNSRSTGTNSLTSTSLMRIK